MKVVEVNDVSKVFKRNKSSIEVNALKSVTLSVEKGEFLSITGASGSGKSTLLHLIGGLDKQTTGTIQVNGKILEKLGEEELADYRRTEVGFVFQKYNLIPMLSAKENIELPASIEHEGIDERYFNKLVEMLGLSERLNHLPSELSGGQQQRVSIARALIMRPSVILADEPTGNLDHKASSEIVKYFKMLSHTLNQTVIMITHSMEMAGEADRIIHISDGEIK